MYYEKLDTGLMLRQAIPRHCVKCVLSMCNNNKNNNVQINCFNAVLVWFV